MFNESQTNNEKKELKERIDTLKIEIVGFGKKSGNRADIKKLAKDLNRIYNCMENEYVLFHAENDTAEKFEKHLNDYRNWREGGKVGPEPIQTEDLKTGTPKALLERIYRKVAKKFPHIHGRVAELSRQKWMKQKNSKSTNGTSWKNWQAELLHEKAYQNHTKHKPIPFDIKNSFLYEENRIQFLSVRLETIIDPSKTNRKSEPEICELLTRTKKTYFKYAIVKRIINGEYAFRGSNLLFNDKDKKWYVILCYRKPKEQLPKLDETKVLTIRFGKDVPILTEYKDDIREIGTHGNILKTTKVRLHNEYIGRQQLYKLHLPNTRGKGRKRATQAKSKVSDRWNHVKNRFNQDVTRKIVNYALNREIGTIHVYFPDEQEKKELYLDLDYFPDEKKGQKFTWNYHSFISILTYKAKKEGIKLNVIKTAETKKAKKNNKEKEEIEEEDVVEEQNER